MGAEGNGPGDAPRVAPSRANGRQPTRPGRPAAQVRGVLADRIVVSTSLDPFLSLRALASYSGLSIRKLRDLLEDPDHPLPAYRVSGELLVRRGEFDAWMTAHRRRRRIDVDQIVSDVLRKSE